MDPADALPTHNIPDINIRKKPNETCAHQPTPPLRMKWRHIAILILKYLSQKRPKPRFSSHFFGGGGAACHLVWSGDCNDCPKWREKVPDINDQKSF